MKLNVEQYNKVVVFHMSGKFHHEAVEQLDEKFCEEIQKSPEVLAIDFTNISYMNSSAIGILVKFLKETANNNIELILFDLNKDVISIFNTAKLIKFFNIMSGKEFKEKYLS